MGQGLPEGSGRARPGPSFHYRLAGQQLALPGLPGSTPWLPGLQDGWFCKAWLLGAALHWPSLSTGERSSQLCTPCSLVASPGSLLPSQDSLAVALPDPIRVAKGYRVFTGWVGPCAVPGTKGRISLAQVTQPVSTWAGGGMSPTVLATSKLQFSRPDCDSELLGPQNGAGCPGGPGLLWLAACSMTCPTSTASVEARSWLSSPPTEALPSMQHPVSRDLGPERREVHRAAREEGPCRPRGKRTGLASAAPAAEAVQGCRGWGLAMEWCWAGSMG